jgi:ATP-binding cassette subfamily B protein
LIILHEKVIEYAQIADVHKNIVEFKEQYKTLVGERGVMLSGGKSREFVLPEP